MKGILLVNLGSPKSPTEEDVRVYLREFLMDKRVIDAPWLIRKMIVETQILPTRPKESAKAYQSIWTDKGSPLVVISEKVAHAVQKKVSCPVALAMRYQEPSIRNGLQELEKRGVTQALVIPLYPQYAMSTTETVVEKAKEEQKKHFPEMELDFLPPFYNDNEYLDILAEQMRRELPEDFDILLLSYHGVPERHIYKTDPYKQCKIDGTCCNLENNSSHTYCYRHQCYYVTEQIRKRLGLDKSKIKQTFQSRLGKDPWLQPYTDKTLENLPKEGIKNIVIAAPAFVADCLETLEELAIEDRKLFIDNGGENFQYISCLNENSNWVNWLNKKTNSYLEDNLELS